MKEQILMEEEIYIYIYIFFFFFFFFFLWFCYILKGKLVYFKNILIKFIFKIIMEYSNDNQM